MIESASTVSSNNTRALIVVAGLVALGLLVAAFMLASLLSGDDDEPASSAISAGAGNSVAVTKAPTESSADAADSTDAAATASETTDASEGDTGTNLLGGDDPEDKLMPDVVCMDLQAAQNEIQDHGVFLSRSEDATGEGRRQLYDRNWVVVAQDPAPGEPIGERDAVLSVVKDDETDECS